MASLKLQGSTSGEITVTVPNVAGTNTLTLPASTGTVITSNSPASDLPSTIAGPAFSAYANAGQTLSNATWTKIQINTEEYDTNSNFDTSLYRFIPTTAGYYQVNGTITFSYTSAADKSFAMAIYKNGSVSKYGGRDSSTTLIFPMVTTSILTYMNGTTDYLELYAYQNTGTTANTVGAIADTYFSAFLARAE